ncbi:YbhB/YbcL family Raf kinase inhibitor-like protein [Halomicroarcula sp. F13]|uniref:YbhB/YbcL family Raf kinase inhibitor-like protein n=1 Tax=Haloarcula rubra TaxID=2487747 RepID=A0AAW4PTA1_9EURY|nr:YbhB/YbcL family Raf kinase inhibitor-like protein [Halomicroarcula rubra]MBX0323775.1 YbhB/YbcL family Raf kinase inhibitor-like protein [Halomicroarcula rubra]
MRRRRLLAAVGTALGATAGCAGAEPEGTPFRVTVPGEDDRLPARYTCDGAGESPPVTVESVPEPVESVAVTVESDRTAIIEPVLWTLWNVPADRREIPAGLPQTATVDSLGGARQGQPEGGSPGYVAPCPSPGQTKEYRVQVYGLDAPLSVPGGTKHDDAMDAISAATLASRRFVLSYERPADTE